MRVSTLSGGYGERRSGQWITGYGLCNPVPAVQVHAGSPMKGRPMAETYNGYCVKCKEKRDFEGEVAETNGRRMAKGICPVCGTKMNRILGKA